MFVYVLNKDNNPLMPCSARQARVLLSQHKAKVIHRIPFTIKLLNGSAGYKQEIVASLDTGSTVVGSAAVANGRVIYQAEIELRTDVSKKMTQRSMYRRTRRGRNTRYRPARFDNRAASKRQGRLAPSLHSKVKSHLREARFMSSILPITKLKWELASFDIHKITNPEVAGVGYQEGDLKGYYNVKQYVLHRDNYTCQSGQKTKHSKKLNVHHVIHRTNGGTNAPSNLTVLCEICHDDLHAGKISLPKIKRSKTKHATEMGVIKSQLSQCGIIHEATFGYETKFKREQFLKLAKTHANDAIAICVEEGELVVPLKHILIKKHIASGDYQQTSGKRSELKIPTGKLFGLRKGDKVLTTKGVGFVKGKRSSGYFAIADLDGNVIHASEKVANCVRISARKTTQIEMLSVEVLLKKRVEAEIQRQHKKAGIASQSALSLTGLKASVSRA
jgi:5-methylcytosine-specific restriction endonuclease McrA